MTVWGSQKQKVICSRVDFRRFTVTVSFSLQSFSQCCGSGFVGHRAKIVRKPWFLRYCFVTFYDFLSLKNDVNVPSKSNKQKICVLKVSEDPAGSGSISQRHVSGSVQKFHGSATLQFFYKWTSSRVVYKSVLIRLQYPVPYVLNGPDPQPEEL